MLHIRRVVLIVSTIPVFAGCSGSTSAPVAMPDPPVVAIEEGPTWFRDVTKDAGIDFRYRNGEEVQPPHLAILESLGGGLAAVDYDNDGRLDLFLVGGGQYGGKDNKEILGLPPKLYRNAGDWKFDDVTAAAGLDRLDGKPWFFTHGVAVGDYDRDGWKDLLATGWGRVALLHNEPDGKGGRKFVDRTAGSGLDAGIAWTTSAAWADFDGDGLADLYLCQYVDWSFANHPNCNYDGTTPDVCPPKKFKGLPHKVFRNLGGGKFADESVAAGLHQGGDGASKGLGVLVVDLNEDGKPDVYVANDTVANFLYMNKSEKGKIRLAEQGMLAGVALDGGGSPNGSMGVDAGDPERAGKPAVWVTNYENEFHALYRNRSMGDRAAFVFATQATGIGAIGQKFVGWGTGFADFDLDGWEDIFIANGHAIRYPTGASRKMRPVLFANRAGKFADMSKRGGDYFGTVQLGRGAVLADFDNDGRIDVAASNVNDPAVLLRNVHPTPGRHWAGIELAGKDRGDVVGARIRLEADGAVQTRFAKGGGSYLSSSDRRFVFGLGTATPVKVTVHWPDGTKQEWTDVPTGRYSVLVQGEPAARSIKP